jgi:hypothetical protein
MIDPQKASAVMGERARLDYLGGNLLPLSLNFWPRSVSLSALGGVVAWHWLQGSLVSAVYFAEAYAWLDEIKAIAPPMVIAVPTVRQTAAVTKAFEAPRMSLLLTRLLR